LADWREELIRRQNRVADRPTEGLALLLIAVFAALSFFSVSAALNLRQGLDPLAGLADAMLPAAVVIAVLGLFHYFLSRQQLRSEQFLFPIVALLFVVGLVMIWRLLGPDGAWQQITRGLLPGLLAAAFLVAWPQTLRTLRLLTIPISAAGLGFAVLTGLFGAVDETGARLALKLGPLPAMQASEPLKLVLILFLAWFIEKLGQAAKGRPRLWFGWLQLPPLRFFIPGVVFFFLAILSLVFMSDYGAVLILGCIFLTVLYAGLETRTFLTILGIGLALTLLLGLILALTWHVPAVIQYRFQAFQNPWSQEMILVGGQPSGVTIAQGPGYQIQQAIYAVVAGGLDGSGLGLGSPDYVPLAHSDFILAAVVEELGALIGIAVLILFGVLLLRIFRTVLRLSVVQVYERVLLCGIAAHLFTQVLIMAGGTLNLLPATGITIPFMSLGGTALLTNLVEIGLVLAVIRRQERTEGLV
jgi:cell division protein FtsW (lipid II flippase)